MLRTKSPLVTVAKRLSVPILSAPSFTSIEMNSFFFSPNRSYFRDEELEKNIAVVQRRSIRLLFVFIG